MKVAEHPKSHTEVVASREAPAEALCPHCGAVVLLQGRKLMDGTTSFFWRHVANSGYRCPGRQRPFGKRRRGG